MNARPDEDDVFALHRRLLFRVAYGVVGSVADADDVVQETWLRWSAADRGDVREPRAYLVRIATTQALNRLRADRSRRETYVGPWLPEPLVEPLGSDVGADPGEQVTERVAREEEISIAVQVVLETLGPAERAVFVLREVFGLGYDEVAAALDRSPAAVRQLAHRAREHVQARRPRFAATAAEQRRVTERFLEVCATGDLPGLLGVLAPDVVLVSDGGGRAKAALRPIHGADKVGRFLVAVMQDAADWSFRFVLVNGEVGVLGTAADGTLNVAQLDVVDGVVRGVYLIANPDKLSHLAGSAATAPDG